jgi:PKD repeat protein
LAISSQTDPEISPRSTAVALVMMIAASGMDMDGKLAIAEALLQHAQFESLVADITAAFQSNAYFLDSLALYPELVTKIKGMAQELFNAYQAQFVDAAPLASLQALAAAETETKTFCDWLSDFLCMSPWNVDEPWTWFGTASLIDVWNPPFITISAKDSGLAAYANPAMVLFAAEGYDANGNYQNWGLVKRNSSAIDKTFNSGAAQTLLRLDDTWLTPETAHIEFNKYRLTFDSVRGSLVSLLNMGHVGFSVVGLVSSVSKARGEELNQMLIQRLLMDDSGVKSALSNCAHNRIAEWVDKGVYEFPLDLIEETLTVGSNADPKEISSALLNFLVGGGLVFVAETSFYCGIDVVATIVGSNIFGQFADMLGAAAAELTIKFSSPVGWAVVVAEAVNDTLPLAVSLLEPTLNTVAGYDLEWTGTKLTGAIRNDARPNGAGMPGNLLPRASFSYSQGSGTTVGFDASASVFDFVAGFEWDFGDGSPMGSGITTAHTYSAPGTKTVRLVVTDGNGNRGETTRQVDVMDGRPPRIQSLTCVADPANPLGVLIDFSVFDEDADLDRLEWYLDANAASPAKTMQLDVIWDTLNSSDTLLYPDDGIPIYAPVLVVYDAGGNKDARACQPISATKVGSHPLNDTGITLCGDAASNGLPCPVAGFPGQDAESGRDVTQDDDSDGHAGFSFTKLDANGNPLGASAASWSCVRDNVTGLIWEVKTDDGGLRDKDWTYSWYNPDAGTNGGSAGYPDYGNNCFNQARCDTDKFVADVNAQGLCGAGNWRLPDPRELMSIVSNDRYNPSIDTAYFPNTPSSWFWSSSPYARYSSYAWIANFYNGYVDYGTKDYDGHVRLVRGGQ